jgi:hypothetical protein
VTCPWDIIEDSGLMRRRGDGSTPKAQRGRKFLSIWFRCCHVYGRIYRNASHTGYEGRCPRCGAPVRARIGPNGTTQRTFEAI